MRCRRILFREQTDIIPKLKQMRKELSCLLLATDRLQAAHHPEAARKEYAFAGWQSILDSRSVVAEHEAVLHQFALDCLDRSLYARVAARQKSNQRHQQQHRVELISAKYLH